MFFFSLNKMEKGKGDDEDAEREKQDKEDEASISGFLPLDGCC